MHAGGKGHEGSVSEAECEKGAVVSNIETEKNKEKDTLEKLGAPLTSFMRNKVSQSKLRYTQDLSSSTLI